MPDNIISIGKYAFADCESLQEIHLPDSITSIGEYAFSGCKSLREINLPDSITSIGDGAFDSLQEIIFQGRTFHINMNFTKNQLENIMDMIHKQISEN